ncbi:MAG: hypothetical protein C4520_14050 [Candidatus Abyssobacteria bacterium SURF_5]|uniref:Uncharacterized protein n=1 Tax=Abyssobacteria bacterium (strain SURF_5) TaxID=2093360 RepID=A0A3A4NBJ8_ABYX5|nr:MAG: hypothetical protein C4520_14050 [Candidatus Abyssubacteria bacterium SURF_5]
MLKSFFQETPSRDKIIFWFFWFFFVVPKPVFPADSSHQLDLLKLAAILAGGFLLWRLLQIEKVLPVKRVVIGIQGFALIGILSFAPAMLLLVIVAYAFGVDNPQFMTPVFLLLMAPGLFLAGCWLGFLIDRPFLLGAAYALLVALFIWRFGITPLAALLFFIPPLAGVYFGRKRLAV